MVAPPRSKQAAECVTGQEGPSTPQPTRCRSRCRARVPACDRRLRHQPTPAETTILPQRHSRLSLEVGRLGLAADGTAPGTAPDCNSEPPRRRRPPVPTAAADERFRRFRWHSRLVPPCHVECGLCHWQLRPAARPRGPPRWRDKPASGACVGLVGGPRASGVATIAGR